MLLHGYSFYCDCVDCKIYFALHLFQRMSLLNGVYCKEPDNLHGQQVSGYLSLVLYKCILYAVTVFSQYLSLGLSIESSYTEESGPMRVLVSIGSFHIEASRLSIYVA
jgi:hypothetical protein